MNLDCSSFHFNSAQEKRDFIIQCSANHFLKHGYGKTVLQEIENYDKFTVHHIYHYFTNKTNLACAVLGYVNQFYEENLFYIADMKTLTKKQRASDFIEKISELIMTGPDWLLLLVNFHAHTMESSKMNNLIKNHVNRWIRMMTSMIDPLYPDDKAPTIIATTSFVLIEGALLDKVYGTKSKIFLKKMLKHLWLDRDL